MKALLFIGLLVAGNLFVGCVGQREHAQTALQHDYLMSRLNKVQRIVGEQTDAIEALKTQAKAVAPSCSRIVARKSASSPG